MLARRGVGSLPAILTENHKQHIRPSGKVCAPDESTGIDRNFSAAFMADRIRDSSMGHSLPTLSGDVSSMTDGDSPRRSVPV